MSSGLLSIARTALTTHQTALQTISHNIANAETPGYSRQEAVLAANTPVRMSYGAIGTGVSVVTVARKRDILLDDAFRSAAGLDGEASARSALMQQIEAVFGEPTDAGMVSALDKFWNSWSDLSANPTSLSARAVVQQRGRQLAQLFNDYDTQLTQLRTATLDRVESGVAQINALASQVAELNERIVTSESNGNLNNDLRDLRDQKLDELANLAGTRTIQQPNGTTSVLIGNSMLVEGESWTPLRLVLVPPPPPPVTDPPTPPPTPDPDIRVDLRLGTSPDPLLPNGGTASSLLTVLNTDLPQMRSRLNAMAGQLVESVNSAHTAGFVFNGSAIPGTAAGNFFAPTDANGNEVRAASIRLETLISNDPARIAASGDANGPSDNTTAQAIAALRSANGTVTWTAANGATETDSFVGFFRGAMTRLGIDVAAAKDNESVMAALTDQAELRRQSISGVNTDEELVQMMRVQQSYTAASKMIRVADEMLQALLALI